MIRSVSFGASSVISVKERKSYVVDFMQLEQGKEKAAESKAKKAAKFTEEAVKKAGRPKRSKNKVKEKTVSMSYAASVKMLNRVLLLLRAIGIIQP